MAAKHSLFTRHYSLFCTPRRQRGERGQALVEYAIVFPLQLMLTLAIIQLAHIFVAKHVLNYAAFCATRAALVDEDALVNGDAKTAACIPLSLIAGDVGVSSGETFEIPVRSGSSTSTVPLPGFSAAWEKTDDPEWLSPTVPNEIRYSVTHRYQLSVPIGGRICGYIAELFLGADPPSDLQEGLRELPYIDYDTYDYPHLVLTGECSLIKPWSGN